MRALEVVIARSQTLSLARSLSPETPNVKMRGCKETGGPRAEFKFTRKLVAGHLRVFMYIPLAATTQGDAAARVQELLSVRLREGNSPTQHQPPPRCRNDTLALLSAISFGYAPSISPAAACAPGLLGQICFLFLCCSGSLPRSDPCVLLYA